MGGIFFHPIVGAHCKAFLFEFHFSMMMSFFVVTRNHRLIPFARHFSIANHCQRQSQWLPFEEARAWARQSGVRNSREWRTCRFRPLNVPSNPDVVYRHEFNGMLDWLGKEQRQRSSTALAKRVADETPREVRCSKFAKQEQGINTLLQLAEKHAPAFEFLFQPKHAAVDVIFRPRCSSGTSDDYAALHVRVSAYVFKRDGRITFHKLDRAQATGCAVFGIDLLNDNFYFFPSENITSSAAYVSPSGLRGKWDRYRLNTFDDLRALLTRAFETGPRQTVAEWRGNSLRLARDRALQEMIQKLDDLLYKPCGADLSYPGGLFAAHNSVLFGKIKSIHRRAYQRNYGLSTGRYECNSTKLMGTAQVPYDVSDGVDLFVYGITGSDQRLVGCFVVPMDVLVSRSYVSVGHEGGLTAISFYPPFSEIRRRDDGRGKYGQIAQAWQAEFYVDLSNSDHLRESQQKFLQILCRAGFLHRDDSVGV